MVGSKASSSDGKVDFGLNTGISGRILDQVVEEEGKKPCGRIVACFVATSRMLAVTLDHVLPITNRHLEKGGGQTCKQKRDHVINDDRIGELEPRDRVSTVQHG